MDRKLNRLTQQNVLIYFIFLGTFAVITAVWPWSGLILGLIELLGCGLLYLVFHLTEKRRRKAISAYVQANAGSADHASEGEFPFPSVLVRLDTGEIVWKNDSFCRITGLKQSMLKQNLSDVFPDLSLNWVKNGNAQAPEEPVLNGHCYRVYGSRLRSESGRNDSLLGNLYFMDLTELLQVKDEYVRSRPVVSVILIDNYDELTNTMTDAAISTLNAAINNCITEWADGIGGMLRKLERNRYLFILEAGNLPKAIDGKFSLLENIRSNTNPAGVGATISMGMGRDGVNMEENYRFAILSLEMALSRGGNQVVIKDRYDFTFYGGRAKENDTRTAVRSRVVANGMRELIAASSKVFIMGHKNADLDAVGAAAGMACLCRKMGKPFRIVVDLKRNAAAALLANLQQVPEYADCFLSDQEALLEADAQSLLIIVDTNRPNQVESFGLLESVKRVCIVDHHRRAADYIENPVMSLHEPGASSASELVTEVLQYAVEPGEILPAESRALLAGIVLDTKNFSVRTTEHTFEAAAFLRRLGADTVDVKKLFKNDLQSTLARYEIIQAAHLYRKTIAVAAIDYTTSRTIAAQAADELLNISGIDTSFVLYPQDNRIMISARSIGDANVQAILEPLGGGGNGATAGAQMPDVTLRQALEALVSSIDNYYNETEGSENS